MSGGTVKDLNARLSGEVVTPDDAGWDAARQAWNLAIDQHPAAVALVANFDDVAATVSFARQRGLKVAAQGTGHGAAALGPLDGVLLVKMDRLRGVEIDAPARAARAEAGVIWRELLAAAQANRLTGLAGSSPDVGVVGYTLGGGLGWFGRRFGLACNSVHAIEVVTADGGPTRVDADSDPDLFWALRGGGGNFGAVTAIEIDLYPVAEVYAGCMIFPADNAREIAQAYREWAETAPAEITSAVRFLRLPPIPDVPEPLRDRPLVMIAGCFIGAEDDGVELVAPLRGLGEPIMDNFETMPAAQLVTVAMDPEQPVPAAGHHALLRELPADAVDAFVRAAGPSSGSPLLLAELRQLGGALSSSTPGAGALSHLEGAFVFSGIGALMDPSLEATVNRHLDSICDALEPWSTGGCYLNFSDRRPEFDTLFDPEARQRLAEVKARWDPAGSSAATSRSASPSRLANEGRRATEAARRRASPVGYVKSSSVAESSRDHQRCRLAEVSP